MRIRDRPNKYSRGPYRSRSRKRPEKEDRGSPAVFQFGILCLRQTEAFFHCFADGFEDVLVACAAAEVAGEKLAQLVIRVIFTGFEDLRHSVNFSGRILTSRICAVLRAPQKCQPAEMLPAE